VKPPRQGIADALPMARLGSVRACLVAAREALASHRTLVRLASAACVALAVVLSAWMAAMLVAVYGGALRRHEVGWDFGLYRQIGEMWLSSGRAYFPGQFTGSFVNHGDVDLYPPIALYLFVPFAYLPAALWWAIPLGVTTWSIAEWRPARWSWPILAWLGSSLVMAASVVYGSTNIWAMGALALALRFAPAAWWFAIKPSYFPLALLFARRRSWWLAAGVVGVASVVPGGLWLDWLASLGHYHGETLSYSVGGWPMLGIPVVAWLGRRRLPEVDSARVDAPVASDLG
jgi:hypothetical protein